MSAVTTADPARPDSPAHAQVAPRRRRPPAPSGRSRRGRPLPEIAAVLVGILVVLGVLAALRLDTPTALGRPLTVMTERTGSLEVTPSGPLLERMLPPGASRESVTVTITNRSPEPLVVRAAPVLLSDGPSGLAATVTVADRLVYDGPVRIAAEAVAVTDPVALAVGASAEVELAVARVHDAPGGTEARILLSWDTETDDGRRVD